VVVDTHVSIVRVDTSIADPDYVGTLMLGREADIEGLAEGSTGQTELRRDALAKLRLRLPPLEVQRRTGGQLRLIAELTDTQFKESQRLAATRDELLPLLMSGRTTVKDAERRVEDET
jgi:type I restriction enzyme S subunit